jgi:hypothetical protein
LAVFSGIYQLLTSISQQANARWEKDACQTDAVPSHVR